ncbi:D-isomer specific 2-hydroxyacid dehydrogenase family protein [Lactovum miscens]|uniref:Lactate dehydrogenase-like 2-hydroxyacid dehydrogenase n=1 Tax=Lactovum miscens TaxID=190387 RepID=A0A841C972_9LACT|nr:D-isomer specific 2-hydroxyacid dehydrogenase family protein [Lactovum miscens]MBB5887939.1 lactate dehydrogenase-like 2-hydroxyacid dehydrogenase [Lactovum miscens]
MEYKIAIVNSSSFGRVFPKHVEALKEIGKVEYFRVPNEISGRELAEKLNGFNIIISSVTPFFTKDFFENKDELFIISRHGIGYNNIDLAAAKNHNVFVSIVPPLVERNAVAENAVANLLALVRQTRNSSKAAIESHWTDRANFMGNNLTGKTFGVIGCGNIGSRVAEIFKYGFNGRVLVTDPKLDNEWAIKNKVELVPLELLLREADFISLNCTLNETSENIINYETLKLVKSGVYITNTARGALIEEKAIISAIEKGQVAGLATDVMISEPAESSHPYFGNPKILVTPHTSAYTYECLEGMGEKCLTDIRAVVKGEKPEYLVN